MDCVAAGPAIGLPLIGSIIGWTLINFWAINLKADVWCIFWLIWLTSMQYIMFVEAFYVKYTGKNDLIWEFQFKKLLKGKELWSY